jgi:hypothetical protein
MNKEIRIALAMCLIIVVAIACSDATDTTLLSEGGAASALPSLPDQAFVVQELAPIESVIIDKIAAKPPNAGLTIVSGLPNSCHEFEGHKLTLDDESFDVTITNIVETAWTNVCDDKYRTVETSISLDIPGVFYGQIETCKVYDVTVNGALYRVQAIDRTMPEDRLDAAFFVECASPIQ